MAAQVIDPRRPHRQDTFDLRNEILTDEAPHRIQNDGTAHASDEEHSVLEDDSSDGGDGEYMDEDDGSSSLSIPNESIDFDLVYSLHNFAATVEGQASVVKGDSLFLMDDSNSYWWLVRVLTTQEVGYIPAENIETPFERLARLNKHRNVDLASATQEELQEDVQTYRDRMRGVVGSRNVHSNSPNGASAGERKSVVFTGSSTYNYPPALWGDEEVEEGDWDEDEDEYEEEYEEEAEQEGAPGQSGGPDGMEPDDGMSWESNAVEEQRARAAAAASAVAAPAPTIVVPNILRPGGAQPQPLSPVSTSPQPQPLPQPQPQTQSQPGLASNLREQTSRERMYADEPKTPVSPVSTASPVSATSTVRVLVDPAAAGETRKISVTPTIAQEAARQSLLQTQQQENAKRAREESAAEEKARKKGRMNKESAQPVSSASIGRVTSTVESGKGVPSSGGGGKLRKGRESPAQEEDAGKEKEKKKKSGVFGGLFGRKKDKSKDKLSETPEGVRSSEDSTRSGSTTHGLYTASPPETGGPVASSPIAASRSSRNSTDPRRVNAGSTPTPGQTPSTQVTPPTVSQHSLKMQQIDQHQQALYQQYLKSSPASHPEGPSYGLQSASSVMQSSSNSLAPGFRTQGGRPGSLILSPTGLDGQGVPELSVIRVFAGPNLHTEATFKTVLLNASTTSSELIRQAMQRFRLAAGEDEADYYLEIKQVEGSSAELMPHETPLRVFEGLVEAAQLEVPRVKRSSVGSISSVSSNLSMHPAIKKLSMNDFTDDSAVKFYLNRRTLEDIEDSVDGDEDITIRLSSDDYDFTSPGSPSRPTLTVTTATGSNVTPERFSSPSSRFALQVFILPEDLPDGMIFDPHTEAIVPKTTLRDRSQSNAAASPGVSQTQRRKVLQFPKNTTVAEVIELALERFGIAEGVVDGGDEVEDKLAKRISLARVRYGLAVQLDGQERQLQPSSKILDAFARPPIFRAVDRRAGEKRRSVDSAMLLGTGEDVRQDDPVFMLRRAVGFRNTGKSRMSAPLDEIALQHLHQRESASESSAAGADEAKPQHQHQQQQMSRQELIAAQREVIAAQREASRANQRAILSAQSNSERGVDVMLPGNAMLRSSLHETGDKMRYSYVQDGEIYDISDIIEEEQRGGRMAAGAGARRDWLEGVVARNQEGLGDNLDRVLNKIKGNKPAGKAGTASSPSATGDSQRSSQSSAYSIGEQEAQSSVNNVAASSSSRAATPSAASEAKTARAASATPTDREKAGSKAGSHSRKQPSVGSVLSEDSSNDTSTPSTPATTATNHHARSNTPRRGPLIVKDDFGVSDMMAIIELGAAIKKPLPPPSMDHVDEILFGTSLNLDELHPRVREMFEGTFKQLDDMDRQLDRALAATSHAF